MRDYQHFGLVGGRKVVRWFCAMFRDVSICGAHFESNELNSKASVCIATAPLLLNENETQTEILTQHVASQTETRAVSSKKKSKKSDAMDKERVKIRNLLDSVGSMMLWEVKHSAVIATFHSGRPNGALNCISLKCCVGLEKLMADTYGKQDVIQLMTLQFDSTAYFHNKLSDSTSKNEATRDSIQLSCTGVSWNATGSIVGISYGRFDHSGWCNYRSALCLWNVFANDFDPLKPMLVLQVPVQLLHCSVDVYLHYVFRADSCVWHIIQRIQVWWQRAHSQVRFSCGIWNLKNIDCMGRASVSTTTKNPSQRLSGFMISQLRITILRA